MNARSLRLDPSPLMSPETIGVYGAPETMPRLLASSKAGVIGHEIDAWKLWRVLVARRRPLIDVRIAGGLVAAAEPAA